MLVTFVVNMDNKQERGKMTKILNIAAVGAVTALLGVAVLPAATYASSYDAVTNTIYATKEITDGDPSGYMLDGASGQALISDSDTTLGIEGATIDDVRGALIALYSYIAALDPSDANDAAELAAFGNKLSSISDLKIKINGDAEIIPNDLGYLGTLANLAGGINGAAPKPDPNIEVYVDGTVTFGDPTDDYVGKTIADEATGKMTLDAIKIELPVGTDPVAFFGAANYDAAKIAYSDNGNNGGSNNGGGATGGGSGGGGGGAVALTSPETGQAGGSLPTAALAAAVAALTAAGVSGVVLRKLSRK